MLQALKNYTEIDTLIRTATSNPILDNSREFPAVLW